MIADRFYRNRASNRRPPRSVTRMRGDGQRQEAVEEIELEHDARRISSVASGLSAVGSVLEVLAVIAGVLGAVGGLLLLVYTSTDSSGNTTHPYLAEGTWIMVAAVLVPVMYWSVARALRLFGDYVSFQARSTARLTRRSEPTSSP